MHNPRYDGNKHRRRRGYQNRFPTEFHTVIYARPPRAIGRILSPFVEYKNALPLRERSAFCRLNTMYESRFRHCLFKRRQLTVLEHPIIFVAEIKRLFLPFDSQYYIPIGRGSAVPTYRLCAVGGIGNGRFIVQRLRRIKARVNGAYGVQTISVRVIGEIFHVYRTGEQTVRQFLVERVGVPCIAVRVGAYTAYVNGCGISSVFRVGNISIDIEIYRRVALGNRTRNFGSDSADAQLTLMIFIIF